MSLKIFLDKGTSVESFRKIVPANIDYGCIAHNLSMQCRFNGACPKFYSVAEHSVLLMEMLIDVGADAQRIALLHDAHEAYLGDVSRPVTKFFDGMFEMNALRDIIDKQIFTKFGVTRQQGEWAPLVKDMDDLLLAIECSVFFEDFKVEDIKVWPALRCFITSYSERILCLPHANAERKFRAAFKKLFPSHTTSYGLED